MVELALRLGNFGGVVEVPVAAGVTIPAPVGDGGHVAEDGVYGFGGGDGEFEVAV